MNKIYFSYIYKKQKLCSLKINIVRIGNLHELNSQQHKLLNRDKIEMTRKSLGAKFHHHQTVLEPEVINAKTSAPKPLSAKTYWRLNVGAKPSAKNVGTKTIHSGY